MQLSLTWQPVHLMPISLMVLSLAFFSIRAAFSGVASGPCRVCPSLASRIHGWVKGCEMFSRTTDWVCQHGVTEEETEKGQRDRRRQSNTRFSAALRSPLRLSRPRPPIVSACTHLGHLSRAINGDNASALLPSLEAQCTVKLGKEGTKHANTAVARRRRDMGVESNLTSEGRLHSGERPGDCDVQAVM